MFGLYDCYGVDVYSKDVDAIYPEMFGAAGNGTADDTVAIQAAANVGGLVVFGAGKRYKVTNVIRLKGDTTLELNGATIICTGKHLFYNFLGNSVATGYDGNGNITIRNGRIIGGAISFGHGQRIRLQSLDFSQSLNDHFLEICACEDYRIEHCSFVGMQYLTTSVMEYINIDPCTRTAFPWLDSSTSPFYDGTKNRGISIDGCRFALGDGDWANGYNAVGVHSGGDVSGDHEDIVITNCRVEGFTGCGLRINDMAGVLIALNDIRVTGDGIRVGDVAACDDVVIVDNFVIADNGEKLAVTDGRCTNLTVAGNVAKGERQEF